MLLIKTPEHLPPPPPKKKHHTTTTTKLHIFCQHKYANCFKI